MLWVWSSFIYATKQACVFLLMARNLLVGEYWICIAHDGKVFRFASFTVKEERKPQSNASDYFGLVKNADTTDFTRFTWVTVVSIPTPPERSSNDRKFNDSSFKVFQ